VLEIRSDEGLGDVPVPQSWRLECLLMQQ
jgi:hypothetical protein